VKGVEDTAPRGARNHQNAFSHDCVRRARH
jgi:hypothetical protein